MKKLLIAFFLLLPVLSWAEDPAAPYHLQPTSPAIGHGTTDYGPAYDLYGRPRVDAQGRPRNDAGAIQYVEPTPPPPSDCEAQLAAANAQIVKLTNQIAQLNDENQNLQLLLATLQADMAALQLQLSDLQSQVSALQMSLNAANAKNQKLISAINNALAVLESPGKNKQQAISKAITTLKAGLQ